MNIACIGWGSLIWKPEQLPVHGKWFDDGPILPIEFTRQSKDGRLTLIIDEQAKPVRTLWTLMRTDDLTVATEALRVREDTKAENIHFAEANKQEKLPVAISINQWLKTKNIDAAIWTGLSYSKATHFKRPTIEYVIDYLSNLPYQKGKVAEEYIRKAPKQIDTEFRREIEKHLGWKHLD